MKYMSSVWDKLEGGGVVRWEQIFIYCCFFQLYGWKLIMYFSQISNRWGLPALPIYLTKAGMD